ncbi:unnamed protein product [Bursaphelenchus okinawaensis]|uniref:Uncharacterized protein n=1 Tax=Bursaphelenchus okinawaensis TaxID=465554 RepID=A0A811LD23_9BILA|nr:unnamed protein product [Bursaphelenchus okinawaensis]CAG9120481.1 unnamed protein product [Bursaphelenchus okinawaensis]
MAILKPDKDEIQKICTKMGVGELFGLFACIVTARSWDSVTKGITKVKSTAAETTHIKEFAASLIPQISQVLDKMPRAMLLILKTNDLLRAIEHRLGSQNRSDAFIEMSKQCSRTVFEHRLKRANTFSQKFFLTVKLYTILFKLYVYQVYLQLREAFYGSKSIKAQSTSDPLTIVY